MKASYFEDGSWKSLAEPYKRFEHIENLPIAKIRLSATRVDERVGYSVEYRLLSEEVWHDVAILRRHKEWPTECFGTLPPLVDRVGFSRDRKDALVSKAEQLTTRQLQFGRISPCVAKTSLMLLTKELKKSYLKFLHPTNRCLLQRLLPQLHQKSSWRFSMTHLMSCDLQERVQI